MAAACADSGIGGWFGPGIRVGVCAGTWVSTCTGAKTEIEAGTGVGTGTVGATVKSSPAAVVSASAPPLQSEV